MKKTIYTSPEAKRAAEEMEGRKNPIECFMEMVGQTLADGKGMEYAQLNIAARKGTIFIKARRGRMDQQLEAIEMIGNRVDAMRNDERAEEVMVDGGIAAGMANMMLTTGLLDKKELSDIIGMIDRIGKEKMESLAAAGGRRNGNVFSRVIHRRKAETV